MSVGIRISPFDRQYAVFPGIGQPNVPKAAIIIPCG
jgi:hypothetical protein